ncbi:hypothetical protein AGIG_G18927 [Arapaima gigas]
MNSESASHLGQLNLRYVPPADCRQHDSISSQPVLPRPSPHREPKHRPQTVGTETAAAGREDRAAAAHTLPR